MRDNERTEYQDFSDLLDFYRNQAKKAPKGVSLKKEKNKSLGLQFVLCEKRVAKTCNESFTHSGIIKAIDKAFLVKDALSKFTNTLDFWAWYDKEILGKNDIINNLKTYQTIFNEIETEYFAGRNKNTKRKRSKDLLSDQYSFKDAYQRFFEKFVNTNEYPSVSNIKEALFNCDQGTKSFKGMYFICKQIATRLNHKEILEYLATIDYEQTIFNDKQSISFDEFKNWYLTTKESVLNKTNSLQKNAGLSWLWVTSMCVMYGLRPSEIAASLNLTNSYTINGTTLKALNDPDNKDMLLYLGDFTYFGASIKTGKRLCTPLCLDQNFIKDFDIKNILLPITTSKAPTQFNRNHHKWLTRNDCPVSQTYTFRHLGNQLGEKYGIPSEIRARSLGHSDHVNVTTYKKRDNIQTTIDLLKNHSKQPLSYDLAKCQLENLGLDLNDKSVKLILNVIYQLNK